MAPRHVIIVLFSLCLRRPYKVLDLSLHYSIIMHLTMLVKKGAIRCSTVLTPTATYPSDTSAVYETAPSPLLSQLDFLSVMTAVSLALSVTSHVFSSHFEQGFFLCVILMHTSMLGSQLHFLLLLFFFPWDHNLCQWLRCQICGGVCTCMSLGGGGYLFFWFFFFVATVHSLRNWPWVVNGEWENSFGRGTSCGYPTTGIRRLNIWSLTEFLSRFIIYGDEKRFLLMKWVVLARIRSLCLHHNPDFSWHQEPVWSGKREGSKWGCCIIHTILCCLSPSSVSAQVFSHFISCFFLWGFLHSHYLPSVMSFSPCSCYALQCPPGTFSFSLLQRWAGITTSCTQHVEVTVVTTNGVSSWCPWKQTFPWLL